MDELASEHDRGPLEPLVSEFAGDPDMMELVEFFVSDLRSTVAELASAWGEGDHDKIRMLAHQLKGAGGGYGFPAITEVAGKLERAILAEGESEISGLAEKFDALIAICRRATNDQ